MKKYQMLAAGIASFALIGSAAGAAGLSSTDKSFMKSAAEAGAMEIQGSQLAVSKSSSVDVKAFANKMINDHMALGNELNGIASSKGVTLPTDPSVIQRGKLKALGALNGDHFDVNYANQVGVDAHQSTIKLFQKEAAKGSDPDVVAFANKALPQLQEHLNMAQHLQASLKK